MKLTPTPWMKAALRRAFKTFFQTAASLMGTNAVGVTDVDWLGLFNAAAFSAILSLVTSLGGIPEVPEQQPQQLPEQQPAQGKHLKPPPDPS